MLNRIRRAFSFTRGRPTSKGRHRRPSTPPRPSPAPAASASADAPAMAPRQARGDASHRHRLPGEDNVLVRPYLLAWERRMRQRP
ncbi:hypothetical protein ABTX35_18340, partial [Streptomyces sp. NPDC096080]|uniref:hypothetical protein n=1 Tax=Streptomyces sp. NPDC096080 TaxID=3156693 RepID=UPI003332091D